MALNPSGGKSFSLIFDTLNSGEDEIMLETARKELSLKGVKREALENALDHVTERLNEKGT